MLLGKMLPYGPGSDTGPSAGLGVLPYLGIYEVILAFIDINTKALAHYLTA